uniref:Uncharacterized protein n=1 Tax=Anopheles albimanus TaxID=7167 RepID=A0A182FQT9_ANOAL
MGEVYYTVPVRVCALNSSAASFDLRPEGSDRSSNLGHSWVSQRSGVLGDRGNSLHGEWLTVDDGVESVDGIGGVFDDATSAIGLNQRVGSITASYIEDQQISLNPRESAILEETFGTYGNVVAVAVLWVRVVVIGDLGNLGNSGESLAVGRVSVRSNRSSDLGHSGVSQRSGVLGDRGNSLHGKWLTVDDGVESVDGIGGVLNDATGAIGLNQRVGSSDNISRAGLLLFLVVSSHGILY